MVAVLSRKVQQTAFALMKHEYLTIKEYTKMKKHRSKSGKKKVAFKGKINADIPTVLSNPQSLKSISTINEQRNQDSAHHLHLRHLDIAFFSSYECHEDLKLSKYDFKINTGVKQLLE